MEPIGKSPAFLEAKHLAERVADTPLSVLLTGPTGTGKEVFAQLLHERSSRSGKPFVVAHCGAIPETLYESAFFGHVRGSFTGAVDSRAGYFQAANGGTLFLDEIGDMPVSVQAKLLRVLESHKVIRVGDTKEVDLDVRIVCATNKDLREEVKTKRFRDDLYWRISDVRISLPALSERREDIVPLAEFYLKFHNNFAPLSREAKQALRRHRWPGNVRELRQLIRVTAVLTKGHEIIQASDLNWQEYDDTGEHTADIGNAIPCWTGEGYVWIKSPGVKVRQFSTNKEGLFVEFADGLFAVQLIDRLGAPIGSDYWQPKDTICEDDGMDLALPADVESWYAEHLPEAEEATAV